VTYSTCPKCHYTRQAEDEAPPELCPACGLVFWKWEKYHGRANREPGETPDRAVENIISYTHDPAPSWRERLRESLRACPETDAVSWTGRCLTWALLLAWGGWFFVQGPGDYEAVGESFLHRVDLVFHEAGHVIFLPFGDFLHILGGSLGQLLMPLIVTLAFLRQGDPFGAAVGLWWLGQSTMDVAIYIHDARALELPLLGGGTGYDDPDRHDWNHLLGRLGWLRRDHAIAGFVYMMGRIAILLAELWGGSLLLRQLRKLRDNEF
jgi:hypothetical protein